MPSYIYSHRKAEKLTKEVDMTVLEFKFGTIQIFNIAGHQ